MKKLNHFLNVLMGSFFGVFVGMTISNYREFRNHPEIFAARSAPWFCYGALQGLALFLIVVIICTVIKRIVRKRAGQ